eukprot:652479-Prorocentrum_minimum.AAC.1
MSMRSDCRGRQHSALDDPLVSPVLAGETNRDVNESVQKCEREYGGRRCDRPYLGRTPPRCASWHSARHTIGRAAAAIGWVWSANTANASADTSSSHAGGRVSGSPAP